MLGLVFVGVNSEQCKPSGEQGYRGRFTACLSGGDIEQRSVFKERRKCG